MGRLDREQRRNSPRHAQFRAATTESTPPEIGTRTVLFDRSLLPWMNGDRVSVPLKPVVGASTIAYKGSIAGTFPGEGGIPADDSGAIAAFDRLAQSLADNPGLRSDDCLTPGKGVDGPAIRVHLVGGNARKGASYLYVVDMRLGKDRSFLFLGGSLGEKRRKFESPLTQANLRYSSTGNVARSARRIH